MTSYNLEFKKEDVVLLADLVGRTWDHYGSRTLFNEGTLAVSDMFLATNSSSISVIADYALLDFENGTDEFSFLRIENGEVGMTAARRSGNLYFDFRGGRVATVFIIRDTVQMDDNELGHRELIVDSGFIVETTRGSIAICKGSFYMQDMFIRKAETLESLELFDSENEWESSLARHFTVFRTVIPVNEVLDERPDNP